MSCVDRGEKGALRRFVRCPVPGSPRRPPSLTQGVAPVPPVSPEGDRDEEREDTGVEGGSATVTLNSKARGVGVCDRGGRSEGGGDGESTAIAGAACNDGAGEDSTRAGGLEARTSPSPCEGGTGSVEGPGPAKLTWWRRGAEVLTNEARPICPRSLTTSRRKVNMTLADQMGMGLGSELNPGNVVAVVGLLSEHNKGKDVVAVDEPASTEKV